jgi:hypothetical protein
MRVLVGFVFASQCLGLGVRGVRGVVFGLFRLLSQSGELGRRFLLDAFSLGSRASSSFLCLSLDRRSRQHSLVRFSFRTLGSLVFGFHTSIVFGFHTSLVFGFHTSLVFGFDASFVFGFDASVLFGLEQVE